MTILTIFNTYYTGEDAKLTDLDKKIRNATAALTFYITCHVTVRNAEIAFGMVFPNDEVMDVLVCIESFCVKACRAIEEIYDIDYFDWLDDYIGAHVTGSLVPLVRAYSREVDYDELLDTRMFFVYYIRNIKRSQRIESGLL